MNQWKVLFSHNFLGVITSIEINRTGIAVSNNTSIRFLNFQGKEIWELKLPFKPYKIKSNKNLLGVLMGNGFIVIDSETGKQLHEGRSTQGGFSQIINRPGGGWILTDRNDKIHIFNQKGFGIKRLFSGKVRRMLGWIDREHLIIHDGDGCMRCLKLLSEATQRQLEEKLWSWASDLKNGEMILQSKSGQIMKGKPNRIGWDHLECISEKSIEISESVWTKDGWWILDMENRLMNINNSQTFSNFGDIIASDDDKIIVIANKNGLLRIIVSDELIKDRNRKILFEFERIKFNLDTVEKQHIFKKAKIEELTKNELDAKNLHNSLEIEPKNKEERR
tara:strand:+ start:38644 stop:39648 length:1005 start_codon:yes stop_codon:yes gene_type:complete